MRSDRLSIERFHSIDKYSPEGTDWAWESADTRRVYTIAGFKIVSAKFRLGNCCSD